MGIGEAGLVWAKGQAPANAFDIRPAPVLTEPLPPPATISGPNTTAPTTVPLATSPPAPGEPTSAGVLWGGVVISALGVLAAVFVVYAMRKRG
jgi:hypothetical protein